MIRFCLAVVILLITMQFADACGRSRSRGGRKSRGCQVSSCERPQTHHHTTPGAKETPKKQS